MDNLMILKYNDGFYKSDTVTESLLMWWNIDFSLTLERETIRIEKYIVNVELRIRVLKQIGQRVRWDVHVVVYNESAYIIHTRLCFGHKNEAHIRIQSRLDSSTSWKSPSGW